MRKYVALAAACVGVIGALAAAPGAVAATGRPGAARVPHRTIAVESVPARTGRAVPARAAAALQPSSTTWSISRNIYLAATAGATAWLPYDSAKLITVPTGWFSWQEYFNGTTVADRSIYLKASSYYFECYLASAAGTGYAYRTQCRLTDSANGSVVTLPYDADELLNVSPGNFVWSAALTL